MIYLIVFGYFTDARGYYLLHYLYTYDHGFISRGFVGEILSWFFDIITPEITTAVSLILATLLVIASSLCIGCALNKTKTDSERYKYTFFLILLLCILPTSFKSYLDDIKMDKLYVALTLFAVLLSEKKVGIWFVPILCVLATMVNPVFVCCSMILIAIVLLQKFYESKYSVKNGIICALSYASIIGVFLFGIVSLKKTGFESGIEMIEYYFARSTTTLSMDTKRWFAEECMFDYFGDPRESLKTAFNIYFLEWSNGKLFILNTVFLAIPIYTVLVSIWKTAIKTEKNLFQKFIFFLCAISPIIEIPAILVSWEGSKYFGVNIMMQMCLIIYYLARNNISVLQAIRAGEAFCRRHMLLSVSALVYLSLFIKLFTHGVA